MDWLISCVEWFHGCLPEGVGKLSLFLLKMCKEIDWKKMIKYWSRWSQSKFFFLFWIWKEMTVITYEFDGFKKIKIKINVMYPPELDFNCWGLVWSGWNSSWVERCSVELSGARSSDTGSSASPWIVSWGSCCSMPRNGNNWFRWRSTVIFRPPTSWR